MERIGASEARTHLSRLLNHVERGESVTITRYGKPVARLVPVPSDRERAKAAAVPHHRTPPSPQARALSRPDSDDPRGSSILTVRQLPPEEMVYSSSCGSQGRPGLRGFSGVKAMYDVLNLKTPEDCRIVMERARKKGRDDIYKSVFQRYCDLVGNAHDDPAGSAHTRVLRNFSGLRAAIDGEERSQDDSLPNSTKDSEQRSVSITRRMDSREDRNEWIQAPRRQRVARIHGGISRYETRDTIPNGRC